MAETFFFFVCGTFVAARPAIELMLRLWTRRTSAARRLSQPSNHRAAPRPFRDPLTAAASLAAWASRTTGLIRCLGIPLSRGDARMFVASARVMSRQIPRITAFRALLLGSTWATETLPRTSRICSSRDGTPSLWSMLTT